MADVLVGADAKGELAAPAPGRRGRKLLLIAGALLLLGGGVAAAWMLVPGLHDRLAGLLPAAAHDEPAPGPVFVEIPEMTVTLPNAGRPRQLRIRIVLEVARSDPEPKAGDLIGPRVNDALITYLRTLRDTEVDGAMAIDRLRGDLFRRLDLLLPVGTLRDVLITGLVVA